MSDVFIRQEGRAGRITLNRPDALNALSYSMCLQIDEALIAWQDDPMVQLVLIDAEWPRAFCAGGDVAQIYRGAKAGNLALARGFWRDEYRMNARLHHYPKPIVSFMHGFTMGGGVGLGGHVGLRIVSETTQLAMPEVAIGLVPDVGGSLLLARAPGAIGSYLALTGARMGPADAIYAGFADRFLPEADWAHAKDHMIESGRAEVPQSPIEAPKGKLADLHDVIKDHFSPSDVKIIHERLQNSLEATDLPQNTRDFAQEALAALDRSSPLSLVLTRKMLANLGPDATLKQALAQEYRVVSRLMVNGDFLEGVRAMLIDKDKKPRWRYADITSVPAAEIAQLLAPLGLEELTFT